MTVSVGRQMPGAVKARRPPKLLERLDEPVHRVQHAEPDVEPEQGDQHQERHLERDDSLHEQHHHDQDQTGE